VPIRSQASVATDTLDHEDSVQLQPAGLSVMRVGAPVDPEAMLGRKVRDQQDHAGKFRFHLKAPNGEIIAASQGYET